MSNLTKGEKISLAKMGHTVSMEQRKKQSDSLKGHHLTAEQKARHSVAMAKFKGVKRTPEAAFNARMGMIKAGVKPTEQCIKAGHLARMEWRPNAEQRARKHLAMLGTHTEPKSEECKAKIRESCKDRKWTPEQIEKRRQGMVRKWASLSAEERNKWIRAAMRGCSRSPNKPESVLMRVLNEISPNQWQYVGDGAVVIGGCNPDFININGKKLIIELFGNYWHGVKARYNSTPDARQAIFGEYGYKTLIVWEKEVEKRQELEEKLRQFFVVHDNHEPSKELITLGRVQRLETGHPISWDDGIVHPPMKIEDNDA